MKTLKICLVLLCLLPFRAVGLPQFDGANFFMEMNIRRRNCDIVTVTYDDADHELLSKYNWHVSGRPGNQYIVALVDGRTTPMHRLLLGIKDEKGIVGDHKNRNTFDNRRINLRACSHAQNSSNIKPWGKSKYLGVSFKKTHKSWTARLRKNGKLYHLGLFKNESDAARAYDQAAMIYHGEFANLNFPAL